MPADYSKNIVYLSQAQYQELLTNQTITVNGTTVTYNENDIYITPQEEPYIKPASGIPASDLANGVIPAVPVKDVTVNGTSVVGTDGTAAIPTATASSYGTCRVASDANVKAGSWASALPVSRQHLGVFYGLSKLAGEDLASDTVTVGTYPEKSKTAIRSLIGAAAASDIPNVPVQDVQVNGTSILSQSVANVPIADTSTLGVIMINGSGLKKLSNGTIQVDLASDAQIKAGAANFNPIVPNGQHKAVFYGLTKAAGVDMSGSSNAIGTYTDAAKVAIRAMLGATSSNVIAVQDEQPTDNDTKVWLPETEPTGIEVPTYAEFQALDAAVVKKTDIATSSNAGIAKITDYTYGLAMRSDGNLRTYLANTDQVKAGTEEYRPIVPVRQHLSVFYGLSKAAGVDLASETVTVGTYPATASAAIRTMLGAVGDVQVNGTSIVNNGIANIPFGSSSVKGVVGASSTDGVAISGQGALYISKASDDNVKAGTHQYRPVVPYNQHIATFYGLAKAAGADMASSSNAVGTYTTEAKAAIHTMLGIDPASIAAQVDIPLVETVSGTTPTITGQPNVRYVCGEVSTITITPPASGSVDVIFESGSTTTTMTVPSTVKWPAWFDAEALEANTTYEILITDGIYGSVMTWAT